MFYQLPPVGNPVCSNVSSDTAAMLPSFLSSEQATFFDSGTAALAAAIKVAVETASKFKNIEVAEVLMPAYACPDLVSAAIFAGVKPVLVDLEAERPWLDLSQLSAAVTNNTVAIIAVNLFGISERWVQLRELATEKSLVLIEDSAQYFPGKTEDQNWQGDLTVLSFGRGKPVSLLGGGAIISRDMVMLKSLSESQPKSQFIPISTADQLKLRVKVKLYNAMISPFLYWLPLALPFLHLGETRYHALHEIKMMDQQRFSLLATNIRCYQDDIKADNRSEMISVMLERHEAITNLPKICNAPFGRRLLRYPILLDIDHRDRVYQGLKRAGLGASLMYPTSLLEIAGLKHLLGDRQTFPNAETFARRLVTLPTHSQISKKNIDKMSTILKEI